MCRNRQSRTARLDFVHKEVQRHEAAAPPRALEGRQRVAQGKRGQESLAPPWVKSSNEFSPLPPNRPPLGDSGGEVGRGGWLAANWRLLRHVGVRMFPDSKPDLEERAQPCPLTLTLSPNTEDVPGEREGLWERLPRAARAAPAAGAALGYKLTPRWGSIRKKRPPAASQISSR